MVGDFGLVPLKAATEMADTLGCRVSATLPIRRLIWLNCYPFSGRAISAAIATMVEEVTFWTEKAKCVRRSGRPANVV